MPAPIVLSTLTPETKRVPNPPEGQPVIATKTDLRDGSRPVEVAPPPPEDLPVGPGQQIFAESFDDQPDFTSAMHSTDRTQFAGEHLIPEGWDAMRQDPVWAPSTGHTDRHESIEILASNAEKTRSGTGKSFVSYRDYNDPGWLRWNSESLLAKYFPDGYSQLYVEYWITFQPGWSKTGTSKIMRISSWAEDGSIFGYGGNRDNGPVLIQDYRHGDSTVSNRLSFRSGAHGANYTMDNDYVMDLPRDLIGSGDYAGNWTSNVADGTYGAAPQVPDIVNGGFISSDIAVSVDHDQIYGGTEHWTKVGIFVRMNSAPGVKDGMYRQWHDDLLILETDKIAWTQTLGRNGKMPRWNVVGIGGNDFWRGFTNEERREEWYAIDDVRVLDGIPEELL